MSLNFRDFIKKEHSIVGKAYLSWLRIRAAATKACIRDGVMRAAEWPGGEKGLVTPHESGNRVDLGSLERLCQGHGR